MQAKYGDYNENQHTFDILRNERLLPRRVVEQFHLSAEEWVKRVVNWWREQQGYSKYDNHLLKTTVLNESF
jgi:hypothetical protein